MIILKTYSDYSVGTTGYSSFVPSFANQSVTSLPLMSKLTGKWLPSLQQFVTYLRCTNIGGKRDRKFVANCNLPK